MSADAIFQPMGALAFLTFVVLLLIPVARFRAVAKGAVRGDDFKFGESAKVPGDVSIPNRNYMNLLELPLLFYVVCMMFYLADRVDERVLQLAWAYVVVRALHSLVHLTYNNVIHRLILFGLSNVVVITLWIVFFRAP